MRNRIAVPVAAVSAAAAVLGAGALASGQPASSPGSAAQTHEKRVLFAVLTGKKEVDVDGNKGVGDPDGRGTFTATIDGTQLCFGLTVKNIDMPAAAHIHKGRRNVFGDVVVPLTPPSSGDPGASSGCVAVDGALAAAILKNPHKYYANVHTAPFGGGAIRGQLFGKSR
jgi:hypothetical protein